MLNTNYFLDRNDCKQIFSQKEIYIFGTGIDAEHVREELAEFVTILAYVDNNRSGENNYFHGKNIISLKKCLKQRKKEQPILVASYRFALEICSQLLEFNLLPEIDFFVWDDMCLFHYDLNTKEYIVFLKNTWRKYINVNCSSKILIPFDNKHDMMSTIYAYCANHFAEKYNASIYAYFRFGADYANASEIIKSIYKAFNVADLIDSKLNKEQHCEADSIFESIWNNLKTWEDWKNITVYGICFGTTIIRDFLRIYIPDFDLKSPKMYKFLKRTIQTIVFWYHYISDNDIKIVLLADGVSWASFSAP